LRGAAAGELELAGKRLVGFSGRGGEVAYAPLGIGAVDERGELLVNPAAQRLRRTPVHRCPHEWMTEHDVRAQRDQTAGGAASSASASAPRSNANGEEGEIA
jgi:hypothetical protein